MIRSGGDDGDLARPGADDAGAVVAPPAPSALAHGGNVARLHFAEPRHHSLYDEQGGHLLQQRRLREAREHAQKPWAASVTTQAYAASDRITHLYEQIRAQLQRAALSEVRPLSFARRTRP